MTTVYWNLRVMGPAPEPEAAMSDKPLGSEEMPFVPCKDVSLRCRLVGHEITADEATVEVFGGKRDVPLKHLSKSPRFETRMSAVFLDGMDDVRDKIWGTGRKPR